jgi:soluble lytic murein transglycosylase
MAMRGLRRPTATLLGVSAMAVLALAPSRMGEPVSLREALARAPRMDATQSAVRDAMSVDVTGSIAPARMPGYSLTSILSPFFPATPRAPAGPINEYLPVPTPLDELGIDLTGLREGLAAYKAGNLAAGDAAARGAKDDLARVALEWLALRKQPQEAGFARLAAFRAAHPGWPAAALCKRAEEILYKTRDPRAGEWFAHNPPTTPLGKLALARVHIAAGQKAPAADLVRAVWREADIGAALEKSVLAEFGEFLGKAEHKTRAVFAAYKERDGVALRAAALAGPDVTALLRAVVAATNDGASDKLFAAVPPEWQKDASLAFARIHRLRKANKIEEAAQAMLAAPRDPAELVDPDEWWTERRLIARKLLDKGDAATAWRIASEHAATGAEARIEAEFHAGWIALRFLNDPAKAAPHFARMAGIAATPLSLSRAFYWQGRAAEATPDGGEAARGFYDRAAAWPATFHGQLARAKIGASAAALRAAPAESVGDKRAAIVRVAELFYALGEKELAASLVSEAARGLAQAADMAALARVVARDRDARVSLMLGKLAGQRGFALDDLAFPVYGVPGFEPTAGAAPRPLVYSIARQESAFDVRAVSHAGARGLMQMMPATARKTAERAGVPFDESRLLADPSFNARLGAAHLGELLAENGGSYILTLAAYNAGGRRVKEWIAAYGDPRAPNVDPVDWIERIPFTETRNYVQRVMENLTVYQARFTGAATALTDADLRRVHAKL